jgi:hypothetical protein
MRTYFHRFIVILLLAFVGLGILGNGEVYAGGGSFDVPQINDHFDKVEKGPAPKKEESISPNTKEENGSWDWITKPVSRAWNWTVDNVSSAWEWTKETASGFWDWLVGVLESITSIVIVVGSFLKGVGESFVDAVVGIWDMITHPIDTLTNIIHAIMNPIDTLKAMWKAISDSWMRDVVNGDANSRANWFGYALGQVILVIVSAKGADKAKLMKGTKKVPDENRQVLSTGLGPKLISQLPGAFQKFFTQSGFIRSVKSVRTSIADLLHGKKVNRKMAVVSGLVGTAMVGVSFAIPLVKPMINMLAKNPIVKKLDDCFAYNQTPGYFALAKSPFNCVFHSPDNGGAKGSGKIYTPDNTMGAGHHLRREFSVDGIEIRINSGHGYNRTHASGSVQGYGTMDEIDSAIIDDLVSKVKAGYKFPSPPQDPIDIPITVNGYNMQYRVSYIPKIGKYNVVTYFP